MLTSKEPVLVITPGLGFDSKGNRIGRGKGYYDRFFHALEKNGIPYTSVAVCFSSQVLPDIPTTENDVKVDQVIHFNV